MTADLIARLEAVLSECADGLESELRARYGDTVAYASERRKFNLEMEPVVEARALIRQLQLSTQPVSGEVADG